MSTNLYWRPTPKPQEKSLSKQLKYILARKYWDHDGSLTGEPMALTSDDVPYLAGVRDGSSDVDCARSAQELIDAIAKFGTVEILIQ